MDTRRFIEVATDPSAWREKSAALRRCGDALWSYFMQEVMAYAKSYDRERNVGDSAKLDAASDFLAAAQRFYGLALETALKAHLLERSPEETELLVSYDGKGEVRFAEARQIGVPIREGHNLLKLAEKASVFQRGEDALFQHDSDFRAIREILLHLSDAIRWSVRYPVPTRSDRTHTKPDDLPGRRLGHYIRDWLDPVLDRYVCPHGTASKAEPSQ